MKKSLAELKILHIGNIANNAYNNAKILNKLGITNDVMSPDYYHVMGCPEWEELEIQPQEINDFNPEWYKVNKGFDRPKWFVQGSLIDCLEYLTAKNRNEIKRQKTIWSLLEYRNKTRRKNTLHYIYILLSVKLKKILLRKLNGNYEKNEFIVFNKVKQELIKKFDSRYNECTNKLGDDDFINFQQIPILQEVLSHYDYVFCYGTSTILPMMAGHTDFVGFEHGTLRDIPWQNTTVGRLTALSYSSAKSILMTNADSINQARALNSNIYYGQHGFLIRDSQLKIEQYINTSIIKEKLHLRLDKKITILQSTRQDWETKGNDKFLKAIVKLRNEGFCDFTILLVNWGNDIQKSKDFIEKNSLHEYVNWISPLSKPQLLKLYTEVDILVDQFNINCIGSTPLEIFSVKGAALLTSLDDDVMKIFYGKTIPLFNCKSSEDIYTVLKKIFKNEIDLKKTKEDCYRWLVDTHSEEKIASTLLSSQELNKPLP